MLIKKKNKIVPSVRCSAVSDSATPWTVTHQTPLSMEFSRQEQWSRLSFPSPGDLPHPGIEPKSPALAGRFFTTEPPGKLIQMPLPEIVLWNYDGLGIKH